MCGPRTANTTSAPAATALGLHVRLGDRTVLDGVAPSVRTGGLLAPARAVGRRAPLLLLDEPTAALDPKHQESVLRPCRERAHTGDAVVTVLHDPAPAAAYAHRVAILCAGRVAADGPPAGVFNGHLLPDVYDQPVEVLPHPRRGAALVTPHSYAFTFPLPSLGVRFEPSRSSRACEISVRAES